MRRVSHLVVAVLIGLVLSGAARADAGFDRWVQAFWPAAKEAGISRATYQRAFRDVTPDPEVLAKADRQAEFVKPLWEYLAAAASEKRVADGREMLRQYRSELDRIEAAYGVDRHILVAI